MTTTVPYSALERTLSVLLNPMEFTSRLSWQEAAHRRLMELTEADALCIYAPLLDHGPAWYSPHFSGEQISRYTSYVNENPEWDIVETRFSKLAAITGCQVAHESEFLTARERTRSAFHRDFLVPYRLNDLTIATAELRNVPAVRLHFSNRRWRSDAVNAMRKQLVRTVLPAFKNGLAAWQQLGTQRAELAFVLDGINEAMLLYDVDGKLVHANRAALALLTVKPHMSVALSNQVKAEAEAVARRINALMTHASLGGPTIAPSMATRELRAPGGGLRVRGALAPAWMCGRAHGVMVTLERMEDVAPSDADIRARFGFTTREVEVAKHVAEGLSNQALAERMGVSFFTARNHVERILNKMGAGNRAQVGALLRAEGVRFAAA